MILNPELKQAQQGCQAFCARQAPQAYGAQAAEGTVTVPGKLPGQTATPHLSGSLHMPDQAHEEGQGSDLMLRLLRRCLHWDGAELPTLAQPPGYDTLLGMRR